MVIHNEIIEFLNSKKKINSKNRDKWLNSNVTITGERLKNKTLIQGKKCMKMLYYILENNNNAILLFQEFLYLSADIRNHVPLKTTSFIDQELDIYQLSCIDKIDDLTIFIIDTLKIKYDFSEYDKKIHIIVKNLAGRIRHLLLEKDYDVEDIKDIINENNKYEYNEIILIYNGKKLLDKTTVEELNLKQKDIIHVIFKKEKSPPSYSFLREIKSSSSKN